MSVEQIESQLARARQKLVAATGGAERARAASDRATPGGIGPDADPAVLSGVSRKPNRKADARRFNAYTREALAFQNLTKLREEVRRLERRLDDAVQERDRRVFVRADFDGALAVLSDTGWHKVVRVNQTSVSVATGYSWVDRIPFGKVLRIHKPD